MSMYQEFVWTNLKIDGRTPLNRRARNLKCSWKRIEEGGDIVRLANGQRISLRRPQFNKFAISLSGQGVQKPALDHLNKGDIVDIEFPGYFDEDGDVADSDLKRLPVAGSVLRAGVVDGKARYLETGDPRIVITTYRPVMQVMIDSIDIDYDEATATVSWSLSGEEA